MSLSPELSHSKEHTAPVPEDAYQQARQFLDDFIKEPQTNIFKNRLYMPLTLGMLDDIHTHLPVIVEKVLNDDPTGEAFLFFSEFLDYTRCYWHIGEWQDAREAVVGYMHTLIPKIRGLSKEVDSSSKLVLLDVIFDIRRLIRETDRTTPETRMLRETIEEFLHEQTDTYFQMLQSIEQTQYAQNPRNAAIDIQKTIRRVVCFLTYSKSKHVQELECRADQVFKKLPRAKMNAIIEFLYLDTYRSQHMVSRYTADVFSELGIVSGITTFLEDASPSGVTEQVKRTAELMSAIEALTQQGKDIVRTLHDTFGIVRFDRYNLDTLLEMYQDLQHPTSDPYILAVYPRSDHNNALVQNITRSERTNITDLGYKIRVVEAGSLEEIVTRGIRMKQLFGKASGVVLGGHGTGASIQLDLDVFVSSDDVKNPSRKNTKKRIRSLSHTRIDGSVAKL
jgi:hypothetical protein